MNNAAEHRGALPPGTSIGDFEIEKYLSAGGFGITYRGWDTVLGRAVAVKEYLPSAVAVRVADMTVHPRTRDDVEDYQKGLDDFLREARVLARFEHHPNIVRVHRFFEAHGTAYIVMEFVEGRPLSMLCEAEKTLDEPRLTATLNPLLDALSEMHAVEFLHRDIKPGNIMLRDDGAPVLIDFGAARAAMGARSQSMTAIASPGYAPIEQYTTKGRQGPWTDIYAVGASLYQAMTGAKPSEAPARSVGDGLVPTDQATAGRYGKPLCDAVDWALRMRGTDRPQSIAEWREVLEGRSAPPAPSTDTVAGDSRSPAAPPAGQPASAPDAERPSGGTGRWRWLAALGLAAALAAGGAYYVEHGLPWQEDPVVALLRECKEHEDSKAYAEALECIGKALKLKPEHVEAREKETALKKDWVSALLPMCRKHQDNMRYAAALECYGKVLKLKPEHAEAKEKVQALKKDWVSAVLPTCREHLDKERYAPALKCYREVLALEPEHAEAKGMVPDLKMLEVAVAWEAAKARHTNEGYLEFERDHPGSMFFGQSQCERKKLKGGEC